MPDNDPFDPFDDFPEGLHVDALPASEVRRRGDRMRRRNTAVAAVGGVVAAAVFIGVPVALTAGNDDNDIEPAPQPTPSVTEDAEPSWVVEIPEDFPVTEGMADQGEPTEGDLDAFPLCETSYPTSRGTADSVTYFYSGDGESSATRVFQLWPDDATAEESLTGLVEAIEACPQESTPGGEALIRTRHVPFDLDAEDSVTFVQEVVEDDGLISGLFTVEVARVGNAVLVDSSYGSAGGDEAIAIATENLEGRSALTRDEMCLFAANPCQIQDASPASDTSAEVDSGTGASIPDDFPLDRGLEGASATDVATGPPLDVCGTPAWEPSGVVERIATRSTDIEYLQQRELVTFITADEPAEELTMLRDAVRDCPRIEGESSGYTTTMLEGPKSLDSFSWGFVPEEGLGGGVFQVTRVGSAILVLYVEGEMSQSSLQPTADDLTQTTLDLAPEMCVFTEDGCS